MLKFDPCSQRVGSPKISGTTRSYNLRHDAVVSMPQCNNCEGFVTDDYVRVFAPSGRDDVRVCPQCEDKLRDGAEVREARSTRGNAG
jgi:hypothetical protein